MMGSNHTNKKKGTKLRQYIGQSSAIIGNCFSFNRLKLKRQKNSFTYPLTRELTRVKKTPTVSTITTRE